MPLDKGKAIAKVSASAKPSANNSPALSASSGSSGGKTIMYLSTGQGSTFSFGKSADKNSAVRFLGSMKAIGTTNCVTCVGVYFQIGKDHCFFAHINAGTGSLIQTNMSSGDGKLITDQVAARLGETAKEAGWKPKEYEKGTLIMVCPNSGGPGGYVATAIGQFLNLKANDTPIAKLTEKHAIVEYATKARNPMTADNCHQPSTLKPNHWKYTLKRGWADQAGTDSDDQRRLFYRDTSKGKGDGSNRSKELLGSFQGGYESFSGSDISGLDMDRFNFD